MHRGTQGHKGGWRNPNNSESKSIPGSSGSVPGKAQSHGLDYIHYDEAVGDSLQVTFHTECGDCLAVWDTVRDAGEENFEIVQDFLWDVCGSVVG